MHRPQQRVTTYDDELARLVADMVETMYAADGVGLAACQIGVDRAVFVFDCPDDSGRRTVGVVCNPELTLPEGRDRKLDEGEEGCLSFPGAFVECARPDFAVVTGTGHRGEPVEFSGTGMLARCLQHETDHTHGHRLRRPARRPSSARSSRRPWSGRPTSSRPTGRWSDRGPDRPPLPRGAGRPGRGRPRPPRPALTGAAADAVPRLRRPDRRLAAPGHAGRDGARGPAVGDRGRWSTRRRAPSWAGPASTPRPTATAWSRSATASTRPTAGAATPEPPCSSWSSGPGRTRTSAPSARPSRPTTPPRWGSSPSCRSSRSASSGTRRTGSRSIFELPVG